MMKLSLAAAVVLLSGCASNLQSNTQINFADELVSLDKFLQGASFAVPEDRRARLEFAGACQANLHVGSPRAASGGAMIPVDFSKDVRALEFKPRHRAGAGGGEYRPGNVINILFKSEMPLKSTALVEQQSTRMSSYGIAVVEQYDMDDVNRAIAWLERLRADCAAPRMAKLT